MLDITDLPPQIVPAVNAFTHRLSSHIRSHRDASLEVHEQSLLDAWRAEAAGMLGGVVTAATTASTSSLETHTRAAGRPPWARLRTARARVSPGFASHTSASTRRKPCQVVPALAHSALNEKPGAFGGSSGVGVAVPLVPSVSPTRAAAADPRRRPRPPPRPCHTTSFTER